MSNVRFYKNTKTVLDDIEISDGQILYATDTKEHFLDHKGQRIKFTPDTPEIPEIPKNTDELPQGTTNLYDKYVTLSAGSGINITGTYPDFTITNTDTGGSNSGTQLSNGYFGLTPYCVNYGNIEEIDYNVKQYLFDENLNFKVSKDNPLIVTFADGTSKTFTSILNASQIQAPQIPQGETDYSKHYVIFLDEEGSVDVFEATENTYYIGDNSFIGTNKFKAYFVNIGEGYCFSYLRNNEGVSSKKNFVPLGEYNISLKDGKTTREVITYPYNINGFNDKYANNIIEPIGEDSTNEIAFDYSKKSYKITLAANKVIQLLPPKVTYNFQRTKLNISKFNLYVYVENTAATLEFIDKYNEPIQLNGVNIGSADTGYYLIEFYAIRGDVRFFGNVTYIGKPYQAPLPPIDSNYESDPFDPFG